MTAIDELFNPQGGTFIHQCLAHIEIADEEGETGPGTTPFMALRTPRLLRGMHDDVYRAHVRELVARKGEKLEAATSAEICAQMSQVSLNGPLNHAAAWVMWFHFNQIFPGKMEEPYRDDYDRQELCPEIERQAGQKAADARRVQQSS